MSASELAGTSANANARKWTEAQQNAITDTGGALLVSAAAGSGKTAVLVERAVQMLLREAAPVSAERLLILTFTNAAAEELRSRIGRRLEEAIRQNPGDARLKKQKLLLKRAFIGTIDAFCMQLVQEHFALLDIAPDVTVADGALLDQIAEAALASTMETMYADADFAAFAALYGRARSDAPAADAVKDLYRFTRTLPDPDGRLAAFLGMYDDPRPLAGTLWGRQLLSDAADALAHARARAVFGLGLAEAAEGLGGYVPAMAAIAGALAEMEAAVAAGDWDSAHGLLHDFAFPPFKAARGADEDEKAAVTAARDEVKADLNRLLQYCFVCTEAQYREDLAAARPLVAALVQAARVYAEAFAEGKKAERVVDFADIEHLALGLLRAPDGTRTALAEKVSGRFDAVMVDEYQDTNELQDALYSCLAAPDGANLFYVGDVKQSIYRFRQANPGIFLEKKHRFADFASGAHPAVLTLGHNFRSSRAVVDGVNGLFGQLMSPALGEVDYTEAERLIYGASYSGEGSFEIDIIESADGADEAAHVAARIAAMVAEGFVVEQDGAARPAGYGDFCILLRSRARMPQFAAALAARGIPAVADRADELLSTPEVLPLVAALCAIDNPGDDVNLAAAMLGPLFRFSADEVAAIRAGAPRGRLWGAVTASADAHALKFCEEMRFYRGLAAGMGVGRLCEELVVRTGYASAVAAMESGPARQENLNRFLAWAAELGAAGRGGLAGFVRLLSGGRGPEAPGAKTIPGHVSLLTIHRSKGLEFPVCFVADGARPFNQRDLNSRVKLHSVLGIGLSLRSGDSLYPTLPAMAIRSLALREGQSEEMRVLYVALTRARQKLVFTFASADPDRLLAEKSLGCHTARLSPYALLRERSTAGWVLAAAARHPAGAALASRRLGRAVPAPAAAGWPGTIGLSICPPGESEAEEPEAFRLSAAPDGELMQALAAAFPQRPARAALAAVPAKLSVSALAGAGEAGPLRRPSFMYSRGLTAAEHGTAQHAFMQFADFAAAERDTAAELDRLVREAYLDEAAAKAVDRAGVTAFLHSPLYRRVQGARQALREYDFIISIPAGAVQPGLPDELAEEPVLVQGIADLVLVGESAIEIVDYKTDRNLEPAQLAEKYAAQLRLYKAAVERRLGLPVRRLTIWSFELNAEIEVGVGEENV